jgi:membrane-associated phospholipid phosphatase
MAVSARPEGGRGRGRADASGMDLAADAVALRPADRLAAGYLAATAALALLFGVHMPGRWTLPAVNVAAIAFIALLLPRAAARSRTAALVRDWYPVIAVAFFYWELGSLTRLFSATPHDFLVMRIEERLFGGQPSQTMRPAVPARLVDEYLHLCYFSYYLIPSSLALWLYARREREAFSQAMTALLCAFFLCAAVFIAYPVAGPYHAIGHPQPSALPGVFPPLAHAVVQRGSSVGTAFPSSHTAVAVAIWLTAWRTARPMFWALAGVVPGLAAGTVYGGFHYATDTVAGALIGAAAAPLAAAIHGRRRKRALP